MSRVLVCPPRRGFRALAWASMTPWLALAAASPARADETIALNERSVLEVVVLTPFKDARTGPTRVANELDALLREKTSMRAVDRAREPRDLGNGNLARVLRTVRADIDPGKLAGGQPGEFDLDTYLEAKRTTEAILILSITVVAEKNDRLRYVPSLIKVGPALRALVEAQRGAPPGEDPDVRIQREQRALLDAAAVVRPEAFTLGASDQEGDLRAGLRRMLFNDLKPTIDDLGAWQRLGSVRLEANVAGAAIRVDDAVVGQMKSGATVLVDIAPSQGRRLVLEAPGHRPFETRVDVRADEETRVVARLQSEAGGRALQDLSFWGGIGALVAAGAFGAWAGALDASNKNISCVVPEGVSACGKAWLRPGAGITQFGSAAEATGSGPALLPLSYSLALTGAIWALGPQLVDESGDLDWLPLIVGIGAGALSYGLSEAFAPSLNGRVVYDGTAAALTPR